MPSEVQNNRQYRRHLQSILQLNLTRDSNAEQVSQAADFLVQCGLKQTRGNEQKQRRPLRPRDTNRASSHPAGKNCGKSGTVKRSVAVAKENPGRPRDLAELISCSPIYNPNDNTSMESGLMGGVTCHDIIFESDFSGQARTLALLRKILDGWKEYSHRRRQTLREHLRRRDNAKRKSVLFALKLMYFCSGTRIELLGWHIRRRPQPAQDSGERRSQYSGSGAGRPRPDALCGYFGYIQSVLVDYQGDDAETPNTQVAGPGPLSRL